ncbi:MAG: tetratricopeptide repeat protein [Planctomycetaceae bacterium]
MRALLLCVLGLVCVPCALPGRAAAGATEDYLAGLDALERGEFDAAVKALEAALEADEENADVHFALGVACTFAERFEPAFRHLDRADRLSGGRKELRLWKAVVVAMRGELFADTEIFPAATRDPYESALRAMSRRYGDPAFREKRLNERVPKADAVRAAERARFKELAKGFVEKIKPARTDLSGALRERGIAWFHKGEFAAAYADLRHVLAAAPDDLEALFFLAGCKLELGCPEGARADYTRCLTARHDWREAYLGRALAQASLGRPDQARADLAVARRQGEVGDADAAVAKRLAALPRTPTATLEGLFAAAQRGEELGDLAASLVLGTEARRLRGDESYQDRLRALREGNDLAALGAFLYTHATTTLTEWVEPRSQPKPLRPQDPARELAEAEAVLDRALERDAGDVKALAFKAACLIARRDWEGARGKLEAALERAPDDPVVLGLVSQVIEHAAQVNAAAAADLRSTKSWSDYWYIYYRWPTQAELQQAAAYAAEARRLWEKARAALVAAAEAQKGKPRGPYYAARVASWDGDLAGARALLEEAVRHDPRFLEAWQELAVLRGRLGDSKGSYAAQFEAANLTHTTATPMLKLAWIEITRTAFKSALEALDRAALDPADYRVAAYRGVLAAAKGEAGTAWTWYAVAAAVYGEAARLRGVFLSGSDAPLSAEEAAPAVALAHRAGKLRLQEDPAHAARILAAPAPLLDRVPVEHRYRPVPAGMLPGVPADPTLLPEAFDLETIAAGLRLRLGDALFRLGRIDEAAAEFEWVVGFERRKPPTMPVTQAIREPALLASAHLARCAVRRGDWEAADRLYKGIGRPRNLPESSAQELEAIREEVGRALQERRDGGGDDGDADGGRREALLAQREQILARRQALEARLTAADASEFEKRRARQMIAQLDEQLAEVDEQLSGSNR